MGCKYLVIPGSILSRTDGEWHEIGARQLIDLYGVNPRDCVVASEHDKQRMREGLPPTGMSRDLYDDLIPLRPSHTYKLPKDGE